MPDTGDYPAADWTQRELAELYERLEQSGAMPASARRLLAQIRRELPASTSPTDEDTIREIAQAALWGLDIDTLHPAFFARMLEDKTLQTQFLASLEELEAKETQNTDPSPLDSLPPRHANATPGGWRIVWQQTIAQVQAAFDWQARGLAYRDMRDALEAPRFLLFQSRTHMQENDLALALHAYQEDESPDYLRLSISVGISGDAPAPLQARLTWGNFDQTVVIQGPAEVFYRPLLLADVLDDQAHFLHDLRLSLETMRN